jgi:hypothetical protein
LAAGVYLSDVPDPPPPRYTMYEYIYSFTYSHREGGRGIVDEPVGMLVGP